MKTVYLSIPYSWNPEVSFRVANEIAAELMAKGDIVFSPISHSHPIADHLDAKLRTDSEWWMTQDLYWIQYCDELIVVDLVEYDGTRLIQESRGVQREYQAAGDLGLDIQMYIYNGV